MNKTLHGGSFQGPPTHVMCVVDLQKIGAVLQVRPLPSFFLLRHCGSTSPSLPLSPLRGLLLPVPDAHVEVICSKQISAVFCKALFPCFYDLKVISVARLGLNLSAGPFDRQMKLNQCLEAGLCFERQLYLSEQCISYCFTPASVFFYSTEQIKSWNLSFRENETIKARFVLLVFTFSWMFCNQLTCRSTGSFGPLMSFERNFPSIFKFALHSYVHRSLAFFLFPDCVALLLLPSTTSWTMWNH